MKRSAKGRIVLLSHLCTNAPMVFQARMCFLDTITIRSICCIDRNSLIYCSRLDESQSHSSTKANTPRETTCSRYHSIHIHIWLRLYRAEKCWNTVSRRKLLLGIFDANQHVFKIFLKKI